MALKSSLNDFSTMTFPPSRVSQLVILSLVWNARPISLPLIYHFLLSLSYCLLQLACLTLSSSLSLPPLISHQLLCSYSSISPCFFTHKCSLFLSLCRSLYHLSRWSPHPPNTHRRVHSYSTCVSLLGVAWGNQIHLQIHLLILVPSLNQGLILFSVSYLCIVCLGEWVQWSL